LSGDPVANDLVSCKKYEGIARSDFAGGASVTVNGQKIPLADGIRVYVPSANEVMSLNDARAYCRTFEVYTDPWEYKVRFIIGRM
jgi:hypothetical protein